ncbi:MAG: hypothetical protein U1E10_14435, partial [Bdellovibrionales bacterium]|nr:hypothetical protein [Bdellovibrionales bacterium]
MAKLTNKSLSKAGRPKSTVKSTVKSSKNVVRKKVRSFGARKKTEIEDASRDLKSEFLNREVEWLEFNNRVLNEAIDRRTPLLERVRFHGIYSSNLDEFFMKRLGGLRHQVEIKSTRMAGGLTAEEQLAAIRKMVLSQQAKQAESCDKTLRPELKKNGIELLEWRDLTSAERHIATKYFRQNVFPVLTPLAVDPGLPFPFISSLSVSFGVTLRHPDRDEKLFARIKVPRIFPQWIRLKPETQVNEA